MIKSAEAASHISDAMLNIGRQIDDTLAFVQRTCPADEFSSFRKCAAKLMADILLDVLEPLYAEHPSLKPPQMR